MIDDLVLEDDESLEEAGLVPYGPDFTPATLGKTLGEDKVFGWLLEQVATAGMKSALQTAIAQQCLGHIADERNRRDMASHVVQALSNYQLLDVDDDNRVALTNAGEAIRATPESERDAAFARHILSMCGGYRLIEAIQRYELRGEKPNMEALNEELGQHPTSKNISTLRAWLARSGVVTKSGPYAVNEAGLAALIGDGVTQMLGLTPPQVEFILAARIMSAQTGTEAMDAADVRRLAETRAPDVKIPSKMLAAFVRRLEEAGVVETIAMGKGKGGSRSKLKLTVKGVSLTDDQIRLLLQQSAAGFLLSELGTMPSALAVLDTGNQDQLGHAGERLAVHMCLMLGLRVTGWRNRLPVEVDLTAERVAGFAYQRWHVQVKNIEGDLKSDRVDREIGAAAGTGATHLLFVVPRGGITSAARAEAIAKSRLTHLHIFWLLGDVLKSLNPVTLIRSIEAQQGILVREKRNEAERRERNY